MSSDGKVISFDEKVMSLDEKVVSSAEKVIFLNRLLILAALSGVSAALRHPDPFCGPSDCFSKWPHSRAALRDGSWENS